MSVEKVDAYREQKKHRKENLAKDRRRKARNRFLGWAVAVVLVCGIVGALGVTGYNQYKAAEAAKPNYDVTSQVIADYAGVTSETTVDAEDVEAETETTAE